MRRPGPAVEIKMTSWPFPDAEDEITIILQADKPDDLKKYMELHGGIEFWLHRQLPEVGCLLMAAVEESADEIVEMLLHMGADPNKHFVFGFAENDNITCSAFQVAIERDSWQISDDPCYAGLFMSMGADPFATWPYIGTDHNKRFNVNFPDGTLNIQAALVIGTDRLCAEIIDCIADDDNHWVNACGVGSTVIHEKIETFRRLATRFGVDVNARTVGIQTPLEYIMAVYPLPIEMISAVINAGANTLLKSPRGITPVDFLISRRHSCLRPCITKKVEHAKNVKDALHLIKQHSQFRVALRILRCANTHPSSKASRFSQFSHELMLQVALALAPSDILISPEGIEEIYLSRRPWFTSKSEELPLPTEVQPEQPPQGARP